MAQTFALSCPLPLMHHKNIVMGHGSGGRLTAQLIHDLFLPAFNNEVLNRLDDQAVLDIGTSRVAFTTDSFVVTPLFFPGGNIGELAVNGTVNDLAMSGARPLWLSAAFIMEEGFAMEELSRVVSSMAEAAAKAGVSIVTGDTKVVNRRSADKLFITTTGIGVVPEGVAISASNVKAGDAILLSGTIADHGMAVLSQREALELEGQILSDTQELYSLVSAMLAPNPAAIHTLRDPTRGGLGASLCEIANSSKIGVEIDSRAIPVRDEVKGACELLGIDPIFVANEGKLVAFVDAAHADIILQAMRATDQGRDAVLIGHAVEAHPGMVIMNTEIGGTRVVDLPFNEQLPRIC